MPLLKRLEPDYALDDEYPEGIFSIVTVEEMMKDAGYAQVLTSAISSLASDFERLGDVAQTIAQEFVREADKDQRDRFYRTMSRALGVDLNMIAQTENIEDVLIARTQENVRLIKSISQEHLKSVEIIVYEGTVRGRRAQSMIDELQERFGITYGRAKTIARDQTSKLNAVLNEKRQTNLGIEEYVWITADDGDRVRESHRKKHGKTFRWDSPPADTGHPGEDPNCRCIAQAVIPG